MCWFLLLSIVKKETSSPTKKKKAKGTDAGRTEAVPAEEAKILDDNSEKTAEEKPSSKEKKDEVKM
jgi:hypothetical protein